MAAGYCRTTVSITTLPIARTLKFSFPLGASQWKVSMRNSLIVVAP